MKYPTLVGGLVTICASTLPMAASAQSVVTIYGVVDAGVTHVTNGGSGNANLQTSGGYGTSRFGFRGVEDLGGGLRASFALEAGMANDTGTGQPSNSNNQASGAGTGTGLTFNRLAYVALSGGFGEVHLGRDFALAHLNTLSFDAFNNNGVAKANSLVYGIVGTGPLYTTQLVSNTISYTLPKTLGGVYGGVMLGMGENPSGAANSKDGNYYAARLGYAQGPLDVAGAYSQTKYVGTATLGDYTHANLGASYDAGFAKFFALYNRVEVDLAPGKVRKNTVDVGAHIPVSPQSKIRVSYAMLSDGSSNSLRNANGSARDTNDARLIGIGYVHDLSKRTALYGSYAHLTNKGQGTYGVIGGYAPMPGQNSSGVEMGLRHIF